MQHNASALSVWQGHGGLFAKLTGDPEMKQPSLKCFPALLNGLYHIVPIPALALIQGPTVFSLLALGFSDMNLIFRECFSNFRVHKKYGTLFRDFDSKHLGWNLGTWILIKHACGWGKVVYKLQQGRLLLRVWGKSKVLLGLRCLEKVQSEGWCLCISQFLPSSCF